MYLTTLLNSLLALFLLVLSGYSIKKMNIISDKTIDELSNVLLKIILPCQIISSGFNGKGNNVKNVAFAFLIISLCYVFFLIFSFIVFKSIVKDKGRRNVAVNMCVFANTGFIGFPLTQVLFGSEGMLYAVIYNLLYNVFMYTCGLRLFDEERSEKGGLKKMLVDPLIISSVVSIALFLFGIENGGVVESFFSSLGNMAGPLSMMLVGSWLVGLDVMNILKKPICYIVSLLRLLVLPLLVYLVLSLITIDTVMRNTIVLISALPVGTLNVILAKKYGKDGKFANEATMQTLVFSVITIPFIVLLF